MIHDEHGSHLPLLFFACRAYLSPVTDAGSIEAA